MLKTSAYSAYGLGFQHLPRDLANVNAWKTMFDPYTAIFKCAVTSEFTDHSIHLNIFILYLFWNFKFPRIEGCSRKTGMTLIRLCKLN